MGTVGGGGMNNADDKTAVASTRMNTSGTRARMRGSNTCRQEYLFLFRTGTPVCPTSSTRVRRQRHLPDDSVDEAKWKRTSSHTCAFRCMQRCRAATCTGWISTITKAKWRRTSSPTVRRSMPAEGAVWQFALGFLRSTACPEAEKRDRDAKYLRRKCRTTSRSY